ncbi:DUF4249 family protein [Pedobacter sp. GR22-6]|uniref:DUF4249 family protein n=1 Tax=Pedobacter sp. GR22-6 TaxID=3127957 RepID=UPI00307EBCB6
MKWLCTNLIALVSLLLIWGCEKTNMRQDEFLHPVRVYDMAIEGGINTAYSGQYIRLTKPSLHADSLPTPIRKASVVVNDGRRDIVFREINNTPGVYFGVTTGDPNYNKAYMLTIKYNDKTYTAVDTLRLAVNIADDFLPLSTRPAGNDSVLFTVPKHTFGYLNPNKWLISYTMKGDTVPAWRPDKFGQAKFFSYTHILGSPNSLYPLNNLKRSFKVGKGTSIMIHKLSLSENYAKYLYSVFMETDWSGLFSGVPVNVEGNVSGNVLGYFSVSDVDNRSYLAREL